MNEAEIKEIVILRKRGVGNKKISDITKLPINTVKSYFTRHLVESEDVCLFCGKPLKHQEHRKKKTFCSTVCKNRWWYLHPHMMTKQTMNSYVCPVCGIEFKDYGKRI